MKRGIDRAVSSLIPVAGDSEALQVKAATIAKGMDGDTVRHLAALHLVSEAQSAWRARMLAHERSAERAFVDLSRDLAQRDEAEWRASLHLGKYQHGVIGRQGAAAHGCGCPLCVEAVAQEERFEAARHAAVSHAVDVFTSTIDVDWVSLLAAEFSLPDGSVVSWAEASAEHHEARIGMLLANVRGNLEAIARHRKALQFMQASNAGSLGSIAALLAGKVG